MDFTVVDGYLLGEPVSKAQAVAALLADRSDAEAALPFYRALDAVGVRAADEALVALRIVLAGAAPDDDRVRRLRALSAIARSAHNGDERAVEAVLRRDGAALPGVALDGDLAAKGAAAKAAYVSELSGPR
jgi:hypothetical protein